MVGLGVCIIDPNDMFGISVFGSGGGNITGGGTIGGVGCSPLTILPAHGTALHCGVAFSALTTDVLELLEDPELQEDPELLEDDSELLLEDPDIDRLRWFSPSLV